MKYLILSLVALSVSSPAIAHVQAEPHVHGTDNALWAAMALIAAALTVGALRKRS